MRNDKLKVLTCHLRPKSVKRKGHDDDIIMCEVHFYECMINPIKSHQNQMRNDKLKVLTCHLRPKSVKRKGHADVIIMCGVHLY